MAVHVSIELIYAGKLSESSEDELESMVNSLQDTPEELLPWLGDLVTDDPNWAFLVDVSYPDEEETAADLTTE